MRDYFYLDLDGPPGRLNVYQFDETDLRAEMRRAGARSPLDLNDPGDFHVFADEAAAWEFLEEFSNAVRTLPRAKCPGLPHMLLKKRYMGLVAMGLKTSTWRPKRKRWEPGDEFVFHDQVHRLRVRLIKISAAGGGFNYDFKLI